MKKCLVILSGGQDSTTCLYWAKEHFEEVYALTIDYGQKHILELQAAKQVAILAQVVCHEIVEVGTILKGTSPLVNFDEKVGLYKDVDSLPEGVEPTFVPARNALFLVLAANRAYCKGIKDIVLGVCEVDFAGYPDCRRSFIDKIQIALGEGVGNSSSYFTFHTPVMFLSKKETVDLSLSLSGCYEALRFTHTCYMGINPPCGRCHACLLRERGFREADIKDPILGDE